MFSPPDLSHFKECRKTSCLWNQSVKSYF